MNKQSLMKWNLVWVTIYPTRYILHLCPTCLTKDINFDCQINVAKKRSVIHSGCILAGEILVSKM